MTVSDMMRRMSEAEFREWMSYYQIEPFGSRVRSIESGVIASTFVNAQPGRKRSYRPSDFVPWTDDDRHMDEGQKVEEFFHNLGVQIIDKSAESKE